MFDISPQLNRKFILISLLGSIAYILLLNLTFGTYFSSYEIMFNAVFSKTFIGDMHYDWISNEWFYFAQLILRISEAFKQLHVYSLLFTLINLYGLFALFYCIQISLAKEKCKNIFLLFLFMVLLFNSTFIEVNNRSITILLCFTSMFNLYLYKYVYKNKLLLFLSISLLFIGLTLRFEVGLLFCIFATVFVFLFRFSRLKKAVISYLIAAVFFFIAYNAIFYFCFRELMYVEKAEHILIDRNYNYSNVVNDSTSAVRMAINMYIRDDAAYSNKVYEELMQHEDRLGYLLNAKYLKFYFNRLIHDSKDLIADFYIEIFLYLAVLFFLIRRKKYIKELILYNIFFLSIYLGISFLMLFPPDLFLGFLCVNCLIWVVRFYAEIKIPMIAFVLLLVVFRLIDNFGIKKADEERNKHVEYYSCVLEQYDKVVFSNILEDYVNYPAKLFSRTTTLEKNHYYLDMFFFSEYNFYKSYHKKFFGKNFRNLKDRIFTIIDNKYTFVSNKEYNDFLKKYLFYVYHVKIDFNEITPTNCVNNNDEKLFTITLN